MSESKIIQNAVKITEGNAVTYLVSSHRHDYKVYNFENGSTYAVDGGKEYIRRGFSSLTDYPSDSRIDDYNLSEESDFDVVKNKLLWGTRGVSGKDPLKYLPFKELSVSHLKSILEYANYAYPLTDLQLKVINYWIEDNHIL